MKEKIIAALLAAFLIVAIFAVSWLVTCGIIKLITMCFGWTFRFSVATGIWLAMMLARTVFQVTVKKD